MYNPNYRLRDDTPQKMGWCSSIDRKTGSVTQLIDSRAQIEPKAHVLLITWCFILTHYKFVNYLENKAKQTTTTTKMDKQNTSHSKVFGIRLCLKKKRLLVSACCILPGPQLPSSPCLPSQQVAGFGHPECTPTYKVSLNPAFMCAQAFSRVWLFVTRGL